MSFKFKSCSMVVKNNCNCLDPKTDTYVDKVACERYRAFDSFFENFSSSDIRSCSSAKEGC